MLKRSILSVLTFALMSATLIFEVPRSGKTIAASTPLPIECDSTSDPCLRIYKTVKDVEDQSYKVVKFTEIEVARALNDNLGFIHNRIKDETGFDCKSGEYKYGVMRCEEGGIATRYEPLIQALEALY